MTQTDRRRHFRRVVELVSAMASTFALNVEWEGEAGGDRLSFRLSRPDDPRSERRWVRIEDLGTGVFFVILDIGFTRPEFVYDDEEVPEFLETLLAVASAYIAGAGNRRAKRRLLRRPTAEFEISVLGANYIFSPCR